MPSISKRLSSCPVLITLSTIRSSSSRPYFRNSPDYRAHSLLHFMICHANHQSTEQGGSDASNRPIPFISMDIQILVSPNSTKHSHNHFGFQEEPHSHSSRRNHMMKRSHSSSILHGRPDKCGCRKGLSRVNSAKSQNARCPHWPSRGARQPHRREAIGSAVRKFLMGQGWRSCNFDFTISQRCSLGFGPRIWLRMSERNPKFVNFTTKRTWSVSRIFPKTIGEYEKMGALELMNSAGDRRKPEKSIVCSFSLFDLNPAPCRTISWI
jgi:hypothetical protein